MELGPHQKQWVEALESGRYKQCRHVIMNNSGGHCCLGVAGAIAEIDMTFNLDVYEDIKEWLGLCDKSGTVGVVERARLRSFTTMNDGEHLDFRSIAKYARKNPESCFISPR